MDLPLGSASNQSLCSWGRGGCALFFPKQDSETGVMFCTDVLWLFLKRLCTLAVPGNYIFKTM